MHREAFAPLWAPSLGHTHTRAPKVSGNKRAARVKNAASLPNPPHPLSAPSSPACPLPSKKHDTSGAVPGTFEMPLLRRELSASVIPDVLWSFAC